MHQLSRGKATHSQQLEKWLGPEAVESLSRASKDFYYPIAVHGVPGAVYAMPGGDFAGDIRGGYEMSAVDRALDRMARERRQLIANRAESSLAMRRARGLDSRINRRLHAFASMSQLVAAATGGKSAQVSFSKAGVAVSATGNAEDLWTIAGQPAAGAAGAAAPTGTSPTSATTGALPWPNAAVNANSSHFTTGWVTASVINNTLLLYDRLFSVAKTMSSTDRRAHV